MYKIKCIARDNGFPPQIIIKRIYNIKHEDSKGHWDCNKLKFCKFSCILGLYGRLSYALNTFNINIVANTTGELKDVTHDKKDPDSKRRNCSHIQNTILVDVQENKVYIGITGRKFKDRLKEHKVILSLIDNPQNYPGSTKNKI